MRYLVIVWALLLTFVAGVIAERVRYNASLRDEWRCVEYVPGTATCMVMERRRPMPPTDVRVN